MNQYLRFSESATESGKTKKIYVISASSNVVLGEIKWFGRWRQYAFFPSEETIWNPECLDTVNEKIRTLMQERKTSAAAAVS